jgi:hypothetical protein
MVVLVVVMAHHHGAVRLSTAGRMTLMCHSSEIPVLLLHTALTQVSVSPTALTPLSPPPPWVRPSGWLSRRVLHMRRLRQLWLH